MAWLAATGENVTRGNRLFADRRPQTVADDWARWATTTLASNSPSTNAATISVIARDGGAGYIQATNEGRPEAIQVVERWHLMKNASGAFLTAVQRSMRAIRTAVGGGSLIRRR